MNRSRVTLGGESWEPQREWSALPISTPYDEGEVERQLASGAEPASAEEYINRVRYQAFRIPDVVAVPQHEQLPPPPSHAKRLAAAAGATASSRSGAALEHDAGWEAAMLREFVQVRGRLEAWEAEKERSPGRIPAPPVKMPSVNDRELWRSYCFGAGASTLAAGDAATSSSASAVGGNSGALAAAAGRSALPGMEVEDYPSSGDEEEDAQGREGDGDDDYSEAGGPSSSAGTHPHLPSHNDSPSAPRGGGVVGAIPSLAVVLSFDQIGASRAVRRMVSASQRAFDGGAARREAWVPPCAPSQQNRGSSGSRGGGTPATSSSSLREWLDLGFMPPSESAWLYAFLARLERPLVADMNAVIRQLFLLCRNQSLALSALCFSPAAGGSSSVVTFGEDAVPGTEGACVSGSAAPPWENAASVSWSALRVLALVCGRFFEQQLPGE